jgi:hypothetical protein
MSWKLLINFQLDPVFALAIHMNAQPFDAFGTRQDYLLVLVMAHSS